MSGILSRLLGSAAAAAITDAYFNLVTLLLNTSSTNGAQNNTFLDSSTNNFTITRNGNTTQGTFTPFSQTGWSNYFNGTSDSYLTAPDNTAYDIGSGDFVLEGWVYLTATTDFGVIAGQWGIPRGYAIRQRNGKFQFVWVTSAAPSTEVLLDGTTSYALNTWYHVAVIRTGSTIGIFINGTREATNTSSPTINNSTDVFSIGRAGNAADYSTGYISNVRLVKGTNPSGYSASSSTLTVPTTALTAVTGTSILTCQSNRFIDNSGTAATITSASGVSVQAFSPFAPTAAYSTSVVGGSGYFDGSADYLTTPSSSSFNLSSGDWTIEGWFWLNANSGDTRLFTIVNSSTDMYGAIVRSGTIRFGKLGVGEAAFGTINLNSWNHIAFSKNSTSTITCYINGISTGTTISYTLPNADCTVYIAASPANYALSDTNGYISNFRIVKGTAVYTAAFTPPTAPLTAITNTSLLLSSTNAGIFDSAAKNVLETVADAQVSTTQAKWGTTSLKFDGTGDWLIQPASQLTNLGTSDFTIEGWFYLTTTASAQYFLGTFAASPNRGWFVYFDPTIKLTFTYSTTGSNAIDASFGYTPTTNTWVHIAFVRSGANLICYANGAQQGSTYNIGTSSIYQNTQPLYIGERGSATGAAFNGYIDDLRITRYARYSGSTYTQPTAAFPLQQVTYVF